MGRDADGDLVSTLPVVMNNCPTVTAGAVEAFCGNNNGSITVSGQGGTVPYTFSIDGVNFQSNPVFSPLAPGNLYHYDKGCGWVSSYYDGHRR